MAEWDGWARDALETLIGEIDRDETITSVTLIAQENATGAHVGYTLARGDDEIGRLLYTDLDALRERVEAGPQVVHDLVPPPAWP